MLAVCRAISACGARLSSGHVRPNDPSSLIGMPVTAAETFDTGRCIGPKGISNIGLHLPVCWRAETWKLGERGG